MADHDPQVLPMADVADRWVVRCDCGCGLLTQYASRDEAEDAAAQAREEAGPPDRAGAGDRGGRRGRRRAGPRADLTVVAPGGISPGAAR